jgi:hypothetical protein
MRTNTTTKRTATIRSLYTGKDFEISFPATMEEMNYLNDCATCCGGHDAVVVALDGFYNFIDSEFTGIYSLNDIAERLEALEYNDAEKLEAMSEEMDNLDEVERCWDDSYFVPDTTLEDYACELCHDCGYIPSDFPDWIAYHIDWDGVARDLSYDGYSEVNGGVLYVAQ